ncbi:MAG: hypothetical protein H0X72_21950 [Acidobacteria bacterium]|jgi:uncharacterized protein YciI|nr:hypothetical protein [Acidobacteriota bacterium]
MKKIIFFLAIPILTGIILGQSSGANPESRQNIGKGNSVETKKQTFIVIYKPGSAWLAGKSVSEQPLKDHGKYLLSLYKLGVLRFAGPFEDDTGGAVVFKASGEAEAKNLVNKDPAVINRIFVYELHPWRLVPWEQYIKK